jgi:hypothetical protein
MNRELTEPIVTVNAPIDYPMTRLSNYQIR